MASVMNFVATHEVAIGLVGTLIVIVGLISGFGRRSRGGDRQ